MMQDSYIMDTLEINLFYLRIMKEHALFLQLGFTPKNADLGAEADNLRMKLNELLKETVQAAKGYISPAVMSSGELFTKYTEEAEKQTEFYTGVKIDTQLTLDEYNLGGGAAPPESMMPTADKINSSAMSLAKELLSFKKRVRDEAISCKIFTMNYPLVLEHIIVEAENYIEMLDRLNSHQLEIGPKELAQEESFWNDNMKQHAQFIDGLLDPTETSMKRKAAGFTSQFSVLTKQAESAESMLQMLPTLTMKTIPAVENIKKFKAQGTKDILSCSLRSIIIPLLSDHQLREANYYLRILSEAMYAEQ